VCSAEDLLNLARCETICPMRRTNLMYTAHPLAKASSCFEPQWISLCRWILEMWILEPLAVATLPAPCLSTGFCRLVFNYQALHLGTHFDTHHCPAFRCPVCVLVLINEHWTTSGMWMGWDGVELFMNTSAFYIHGVKRTQGENWSIHNVWTI